MSISTGDTEAGPAMPAAERWLSGVFALLLALAGLGMESAGGTAAGFERTARTGAEAGADSAAPARAVLLAQSRADETPAPADHGAGPPLAMLLVAAGLPPPPRALPSRQDTPDLPVRLIRTDPRQPTGPPPASRI